MNEQITPDNKSVTEANSQSAATPEAKKKASPEKRKNLFFFLIVMLAAFALLVLLSLFMQQRFKDREQIRTFSDKTLALQDENVQLQSKVDELTAELSAATEVIAEMEETQADKDKEITALSALLLLYRHVDRNAQTEAKLVAEQIMQEGYSEYYLGENKTVYEQLLKKIK